ncbi:exocyst complex component 1-like [Oncorhynchus mykiss]|uniref:exocyst complex component 1-like n=1 Tax=Oncorhynchus mykiss TaxID=8022 RepID=UPI00187857AA|nr:exocyst complex component 1-like [Oncorhynchus mykiss]
MSSLLRKEMQRMLFRPEGQKLQKFIEIHEATSGRTFSLCLRDQDQRGAAVCGEISEITLFWIKQVAEFQNSGSKKKLKSQFCLSSCLEDSYLRTEVWLLQDLTLLDGRDPDVDDPCFLMHFSTVRSVTAFSCGAKYSMARALVALSDKHCGRPLTLVNYDLAYIGPSSIYLNRGDCVVLMQICFYAANLVCLSLCPYLWTESDISIYYGSSRQHYSSWGPAK